MAHATRTVLFACLCMANACTHAYNNELKKESNAHMNQTQINSFETTDKNGNRITLEWQQSSFTDPVFAQAMKRAWEVARPAYVPVEMQFLKAFPEIVATEPYFKAFEALFTNGIEQVDWVAAETIMTNILQGHFIFEPAMLSDAIVKAYGQDSCIMITAKDSAGTLLGFAAFMARATYPQGTVKVMALGVLPEHQKRGLGKILMSTIFNIMPATTKLFLCTRVTNNTALAAYKIWGFVHDAAPIMDHLFNLDHWTFLTYNPAEKSVLQTVANTLKV
ncbi:GNAT family N-acetyltransferase [Candidatus Dependentiae bacterium]|nr:GNAT family N-acetyltransferase [Candidatus Dependentiae bacterium]